MLKYLLHIFFVVAAAIVLEMIWLVYLSPIISPAFCWCVAVLALFYPVLFVLALVFLVLTLLLKRFKLSTLFLLTLLAGWGYTGKWFNLINHAEKLNEPLPEISVLSYNVEIFSLYKHINNPNRTQIIHFLDSLHTDIICLQESVWDDRHVFKTTDTLSQLGHYYLHQDCGRSNRYFHFGAATLSRYPIVGTRSVPFDNDNNVTLITDIKIGNDTIRVINTHLQSNHFTPQEHQYLDDPDIAFEQTKGILKRLKNAFIKRTHQIEYLENELASSPYPILLCGDFNDIPNSYTYHIFSKYLHDSFLKSGYGLGTTYNELLLKYRIDYIFYDTKKFNNLTFNVCQTDTISDHLPVYAEFQLKSTP